MIKETTKKSITEILNTEIEKVKTELDNYKEPCTKALDILKGYEDQEAELQKINDQLTAKNTVKEKLLHHEICPDCAERLTIKDEKRLGGFHPQSHVKLPDQTWRTAKCTCGFKIEKRTA